MFVFRLCPFGRLQDKLIAEINTLQQEKSALAQHSADSQRAQQALEQTLLEAKEVCFLLVYRFALFLLLLVVIMTIDGTEVTS